MLFILLFVPGIWPGPASSASPSASRSARRRSGSRRIFTKIADIGSDLMKIVFKIKEDDARNPVIADCTGDNAGTRSAHGGRFETYGVTGVALITSSSSRSGRNSTRGEGGIQIQLLVWIFVMRIG